jgi:hypothetical protein
MKMFRNHKERKALIKEAQRFTSSCPLWLTFFVNFVVNFIFKLSAVSLTLFIFIFLFSSCNVINPAEPVPGYIHIDKFNITSTPTLGTDSSKITDVYVYIDNGYQGAYPLGASFPVLNSGSHQMQFYAGVIMNGISTTRILYPFYDSYNQTVDLEPGKTITIQPVIKYSSFTECAWCESFDNAGVSLAETDRSDTNLTVLALGNANNFEGKSGAVYLDDAHPFFELFTDTSYDLYGSSNVYLEMNYRCNNSLNVGMVAYSSSSTDQFSVEIINPKTVWNKIYVELTPSVRTYTTAYGFKIFLGATKDEGVTNAEFYFDNFKLLKN